jgi:hypothetical protein
MSAKTLRTITLIGHSRFSGYGVDRYVLLVHSVIIYDRRQKVKDFLGFFVIFEQTQKETRRSGFWLVR